LLRRVGAANSPKSATPRARSSPKSAANSFKGGKRSTRKRQMRRF
jgi:hypothetical protein